MKYISCLGTSALGVTEAIAKRKQSAPSPQSARVCNSQHFSAHVLPALISYFAHRRRGLITRGYSFTHVEGQKHRNI